MFLWPYVFAFVSKSICCASMHLMTWTLCYCLHNINGHFPSKLEILLNVMGFFLKIDLNGKAIFKCAINSKTFLRCLDIFENSIYSNITVDYFVNGQFFFIKICNGAGLLENSLKCQMH